MLLDVHTRAHVRMARNCTCTWNMHVYIQVFMNLNVDDRRCQHMLDQADTIIRLYGTLILSQAWLVWKTRDVTNPHVRKTFVESYFVCFTISTCVLGYRQVFSSDWNGLNWLTTTLFGTLAAIYGWFLLTKPAPEFEHSATAAV